jgi:hypothetical protein
MLTRPFMVFDVSMTFGRSNVIVHHNLEASDAGRPSSVKRTIPCVGYQFFIYLCSLMKKNKF